MKLKDFSKYPNPVQNTAKLRPKKTGFIAAEYERFMANRLTIIDKYKKEVSFKPNPAQQNLNYWMERYYDILVLKARKMGFSSDALAIATAKFLLGKNENCVSMSFDADASVRQLARAKHYLRSYERLTGAKVALRYNRLNAMVFEGEDKETGETWVNTLRVGTAQSTGFGRGDDISYLHLTEVSMSDVPLLLAGVGEACVYGAHKILETTANGFNSYKEFWDSSVLGETGYLALFYSPLWEYNQEFITAKRKALGRLGPQEYPMDPLEAFVTSGDMYFDQVALAWYLKNAQEPINVS